MTEGGWNNMGCDMPEEAEGMDEDGRIDGWSGRENQEMEENQGRDEPGASGRTGPMM